MYKRQSLTFSVLASPSNGTVSLTGSSSRIITQDPASINDYLFQQAAQNRIEARDWPSSGNSEAGAYQGNFIYDPGYTVLPQYSAPGSRTNTEEAIGSWDVGTWSGVNRTRGNHFLITAVDTVVELRFYMSIDSSTSLYYMVYKSATEQGTYELVDSNYVASSGTGEGWYSSGAMNAPLEVGKYYLFATSWSDTVTYGRGTPTCSTYTFGTHEGSILANDLYEPGSTYDGSLLYDCASITGAYYQTVVTGTPGIVTTSSSSAYTYSPNANYNGSDSFTFTASDGTLLDTATVSITVTAVSDGPPVASNATVTTNEDTDYSGTLVATDEYGDTLTYRVLTSPSNGTATCLLYTSPSPRD